MLEFLPQGILILDPQGRYVHWNRKYADLYRGSADLFAVGARLEDTLRIGVERRQYPEAIGREEDWLRERRERLCNPGEPFEQQMADGRCILIEERKTDDGSLIGLRVDITERKQREESFRLLFEANPIPMLIVASDTGQIVEVNQAAVDHYGYTRDEFLRLRLSHLEDSPSRPGECPSARPKGAVVGHRAADGTPMDVSVYANALVYNGRPACLLAAIDVTERRHAERRVAHMALHDSLTGLPNREHLMRALKERIDRAPRTQGRPSALLYFDLDGFKAVNDTHGHAAGDAVLQCIARRISRITRPKDVLARLGGDEFALIADELAHPSNAGFVAARIIEAVEAPIRAHGAVVRIGASVGICVVPDQAESCESILQHADIALYRAKEEGKGKFRFFERHMNERLRQRRTLENDLATAIREQQFELHYQPIFDLRSRSMACMEALVRWRHPARGLVAPGEFIPLAEETGLVAEIGEWALHQACRDAMQMPDPVRVAVNLSPIQFRGGRIVEIVCRALAEATLPPSRLELEITETVFLETSDMVLSTLHALRQLGVRIAMDDFGTGYSSLSYLRSFPFDKIKIDRSFIKDIDVHENTRSIVLATLALSRSLNMRSVAEGIETEADRRWLREHGCDDGQGFLLGRPAPIEHWFPSTLPAAALRA